MSNSTYRPHKWPRRISRRRFVIAGITSGAGLAALACANTTTAPAAPTTAPAAPAAAPTTGAAAPAATTEPAPKQGGVLKLLATGEYQNLDPHELTSQVFYGQGHGMAYSRLVKPSAGPDRKGDEMLIVGEVAEKWDQADDLTYVFKIRQGLKFQNLPPVNGRQVTAEDVRYSFDRQKSLGKTNGFLPNFAKVEVVDPQTLKLTLAAPDADFLITLAAFQNVVVAKEAVDVKGDLKEGPTIGSGAWMAESWQPNSVARMKKNPDWYVKGVPYMDAMEFLRVSDASVGGAAFRTQQVGNSKSAGLSRPDLEALKKSNPELVIYLDKRMGAGNFMGFDVTKPPFTDVRVRQAFRMAIDFNQIKDTAWYGDGIYATTLQLPGFDWNLPDSEYETKWLKRDVAGAKQLLSAAGFPASFNLEFVFLKLLPEWQSAAELTIAQLKDLGVTGTLKIVDIPGWNTNQAGQGDYQAYHGPVQTQSSANADLRLRYFTKGNRNASKISDPKLDDMITKQSVMARDPEGRKKALMDIQRYLMDQGYLIPIWGYAQPIGRWPWFMNFRDVGQPQSDPEPYAYAWLNK
jgi:ABC-type transport system substrate-binding protein